MANQAAVRDENNFAIASPFAPHIAEELWARLHSTFGQTAPSLAYASWPKFDAALLVESEIEIPVQVNGKFRDTIKVAVEADNATIEAAAKASEKAQQFIAEGYRWVVDLDLEKFLDMSSYCPLVHENCSNNTGC